MSTVGQIRETRDPGTYNTLVHHHLRSDGLPACGDLVRPWKGRPMMVIQLAPSTPVTCQRNGCRGT